MSETIRVTLTASFEYDSENFDDLTTIQAEAMAIDAVLQNDELLTSEIEVLE